MWQITLVARNVELREFLRACRGRIRPEEAGLPVGGNRRVPGLRREELAMLAGVSVDYYVRLEQGRDVRPSDLVLDSIARVLRLTATQRAHLYTLARAEPAPRDEMSREVVRPNVRRLLDFLDTPAMVVGRGTAVLGCNPLCSALITDFPARSPKERFYAHWLFTDPTAHEVLLDWEQAARETVGVLRADATRFRGDDDVRALIDELSAKSESFQALWDEHDVEAHTSGRKRYRHPVAGKLTVLHEATKLEDDQWLYLYWVERGSTSEHAMERLSAWVADHGEPSVDDRGATGH